MKRFAVWVKAILPFNLFMFLCFTSVILSRWEGGSILRKPLDHSLFEALQSTESMTSPGLQALQQALSQASVDTAVITFLTGIADLLQIK